MLQISSTKCATTRRQDREPTAIAMTETGIIPSRPEVRQTPTTLTVQSRPRPPRRHRTTRQNSCRSAIVPVTSFVQNNNQVSNLGCQTDKKMPRLLRNPRSHQGGQRERAEEILPKIGAAVSSWQKQSTRSRRSLQSRRIDLVILAEISKNGIVSGNRQCVRRSVRSGKTTTIWPLWANGKPALGSTPWARSVRILRIRSDSRLREWYDGRGDIQHVLWRR